MSTRVPLAVTALRIRDNISAMGSVISLSALHSCDLVIGQSGNRVIRLRDYSTTRLPTALRNPSDAPIKRELAEAEAAQGERAHIRARPPAQTAAVAQPDLEFRRLRFL